MPVHQMSGSKLTQATWIEKFAIELAYRSNRFHKGDVFTMNTTLVVTVKPGFLGRRVRTRGAVAAATAFSMTFTPY